MYGLISFNDNRSKIAYLEKNLAEISIDFFPRTHNINWLTLQARY